MEFNEVKTKLEFGLVVLGFEYYDYKLADLPEWIETGKTCEQGQEKHYVTEGKACGDCRRIYIPVEAIQKMTNDTLAACVHSIGSWLSKSRQHPLKVKV